MILFCCALHYVHSSFALILMRKRKLVALLSLSFLCLVIFVCLFLMVPWVCPQFVMLVFADHTHLLFLRPCYTTSHPYLPYSQNFRTICQVVTENSSGHNLDRKKEWKKEEEEEEQKKNNTNKKKQNTNNKFPHFCFGDLLMY